MKRYEYVKNVFKMKLIKGVISTTNKLSQNLDKEQESLDIDHAKSTTQGKLLPTKERQTTSIMIQEEDLINTAEMLREKIVLKIIIEEAENPDEKDLPTVTSIIRPNIVPVFEAITQNIMTEKLNENVLSFETSQQEESSEYTPSEDSPPVDVPRRRRFTEHFEKIIARRASSKKFRTVKTNPAKVPSVLLEGDHGGYKVNHKAIQELDQKQSLGEEIDDDEEEDSEDSESDQSNEDDSDLDNSMEVPLEMFEPTYEDTDEADLIIKSLKVIFYPKITLISICRQKYIRIYIN